jgi:hypothetical protein
MYETVHYPSTFNKQGILGIDSILVFRWLVVIKLTDISYSFMSLILVAPVRIKPNDPVVSYLWSLVLRRFSLIENQVSHPYPFTSEHSVEKLDNIKHHTCKTETVQLPDKT